MRVVLLGLPGAGKGTQGERISEKYGIPHISTGSMIRSVIDSGSQLGEVINKYISTGNLIPDDYIIEMVQQRVALDDCRKGWILDGFPRTVQQAINLDASLAEKSMQVDYAFDIRITEEEAIRRIEQRRMCRECGQVYNLLYYHTAIEGVCDKCGGELYQRMDDNLETASERLSVYMRQTHPVVHYYAQAGKLISINGERDINDVFIEVDVLTSELFFPGHQGEVS